MREYVADLLNGLNIGTVAYDRLPVKSELPLITYNLPNFNEIEQHRTDILLEISIWARATPPGMQHLESTSKAIDDSLNRHKSIDSTKQVTIYRNNPYKAFLDDEDPEIKQCKLRYIMKTYYI